MRKKTILSVGALTLVAGLGLAAMSGSNLLPLVTSASVSVQDAAALILMDVTPASGSNIALWQAPGDIQLRFTDANPGTFGGVVVNHNLVRDVVIYKKGVDGAADTEVGRIPASSESGIYVDRSNPSLVHINVSTLQDFAWDADYAPGYVVVVPSGLIVKDVDSASLDPDGNEASASTNQEIRLDYYIVDTPKYTKSPSNGAVVSTANGGFSNNVAITWDAEKVKSLGLVGTDVPQIGLYMVDPSVENTSSYGSRELVAQFKPVFEGNVMKLELEKIDGKEVVNIPSSDRVKYYEIVVPEGFVNLYDEAGKVIGVNEACTMTNLKLEWLFNASMIEVVAPLEAEATLTPSEFPKEFSLYFPNRTAATTTTGKVTLNMYRDNSTTILASYVGEFAEDQHTLNLTIGDITPGAAKNDPSTWFDGTYTFKTITKTFMDLDAGEQFGQNLVFPMKWVLTDGVNYAQLASKEVNATGALLSDGSKEVKVAEVAFDDVPQNPGFGSMTLKFLYSVVPTGDANTKISLYKDGEDTPLWEQENTGKYNNDHLWSGTAVPTKTKAAAATASTSMSIFNGFTGEYYKTSPTSSVEYRYVDYLTEPGNYRLVIDPGYFTIKVTNQPSYLNERIEVPFSISGPDIEYSVYPESGSEVKSMKEFTITYPEGAVVTVPEGTTVQLVGQNSLLSGVDQYNNYTLSVSASGNVVKFEADEEILRPCALGFTLQVPAKTWTVNYNGDVRSNREMGIAYTFVDVPAGKLSPAPGEVQGADLQTVILSSNAKVKGLKAAPAGEIAPQAALYSVAEDGTRTQVATYTFSNKPTDGDIVEDCEFTTAVDTSELPEGHYQVVIPSGVLEFYYYSKFVQSQDYVYDFEIASSVNAAELFTPAMPSTFTPSYTSTNGLGMKVLGLEFEDASLASNPNCVAPVVLEFDGNVIATVEVKDVWVDAPVPSWNIAGAVSITWPEGADYNATGKYVVKFPAGAFTLEGKEVGAFELTYDYINDKPVINFDYTLDPAPGAPVKDLSTIVLHFDNASFMSYCSNSANPVATLESEDGSVKVNCVWPKNNWTNELTLDFSDADGKWVAGKYTLTVHKGAVVVDDETIDDSVPGNGNFEGLTAVYELEVEAGAEPLLNHMTLSHPATLECDVHSTRTAFGSGMGIIVLGIDTDNAEGVENSDPITLSYSANENGEYEVLSSVYSYKEFEVNFGGVGAAADDELIEFPVSYYINMLFFGDGEGGYNFADMDKFGRTGYYRLDIPEGAFKFDDKLMSGASLLFSYDAEGRTLELVYTLTPAPTEVLTDHTIFNYGKSGITVDFPDATTVDFVGNGGATLTAEDGTVFKGYTASYEGRTGVKYTFNTAGNEWKNGTYTFRVPEKYIAVNMGYLDDGDLGNSPEITATYHLEDETLSVALIGVGAAESYNVFTLDGKVVKLNAAIEELKELEPGLYIINGKKAYLRK
ncbi:MAG: hypothetical protein K2I48_02800 [Muribaculaceae bacterium]|nr:hypothetical protein [Muribaculaceae bacterium]